MTQLVNDVQLLMVGRPPDAEFKSDGLVGVSNAVYPDWIRQFLLIWLMPPLESAELDFSLATLLDVAARHYFYLNQDDSVAWAKARSATVFGLRSTRAFT